MSRLRSTMAFIVACGVLTACGSVAAPHATAPSQASVKKSPAGSGHVAHPLIPVKVEVSWLPSTSQLPVYLAFARGYYRAHGLAVTITSGKGSVLTVQQIGAGKFDIGLADLTSMAELRAKGAPVEAVMAETDRTTFGLTVAKASGIKTWKDLYGKSLLITAGNGASFLLPATFDKLGLNMHKVRIDSIPAANLDADYMAGKADGAAGDVAGAFVRENAKRPSRALWFGDELNVVGYGLLARKSYISAHPKVIRAFTAATAEALKALAGSPGVAREATRDMIAQNPGHDYTVKDFAPAWPYYQRFIHQPAGHPIGWQDIASWRTTLSVLHRFAGLKGDMNPSDYFTNKYLG